MLSKVDTDDSIVAIVKQRTISNGISVSHLRSGNFAVSVHDGDRRAIIELSADQLRDFGARLLRFLAECS